MSKFLGEAGLKTLVNKIKDFKNTSIKVEIIDESNSTSKYAKGIKLTDLSQTNPNITVIILSDNGTTSKTVTKESADWSSHTLTIASSEYYPTNSEIMYTNVAILVYQPNSFSVGSYAGGSILGSWIGENFKIDFPSEYTGNDAGLVPSHYSENIDDESASDYSLLCNDGKWRSLDLSNKANKIQAKLELTTVNDEECYKLSIKGYDTTTSILVESLNADVNQSLFTTISSTNFKESDGVYTYTFDSSYSITMESCINFISVIEDNQKQTFAIFRGDSYIGDLANLINSKAGENEVDDKITESEDQNRYVEVSILSQTTDGGHDLQIKNVSKHSLTKGLLNIIAYDDSDNYIGTKWMNIPGDTDKYIKDAQTYVIPYPDLKVNDKDFAYSYSQLIFTDNLGSGGAVLGSYYGKYHEIKDSYHTLKTTGDGNITNLEFTGNGLASTFNIAPGDGITFSKDPENDYSPIEISSKETNLVVGELATDQSKNIINTVSATDDNPSIGLTSAGTDDSSPEVGNNHITFKGDSSINVQYKKADSSININMASSPTFSGDVTANAFYESSDKKLKENVKDIDADFSKVELKEFNFKGDDTKKYGVIAQQLEEIGLGNLVKENKDGIKSVDYISLLIGMINDLRKEIKELKK